MNHLTALKHVAETMNKYGIIFPRPALEGAIDPAYLSCSYIQRNLVPHSRTFEFEAKPFTIKWPRLIDWTVGTIYRELAKIPHIVIKPIFEKNLRQV